MKVPGQAAVRMVAGQARPGGWKPTDRQDRPAEGAGQTARGGGREEGARDNRSDFAPLGVLSQVSRAVGWRGWRGDVAGARVVLGVSAHGGRVVVEVAVQVAVTVAVARLRCNEPISSCRDTLAMKNQFFHPPTHTRLGQMLLGWAAGGCVWR